jgi:hypothetical protein
MDALLRFIELIGFIQSPIPQLSAEWLLSATEHDCALDGRGGYVEVTIWAAIIAATVSFALFFLKQIIDWCQERSKKKVLEKTCLLIPLLYELRVLELAVKHDTNINVLRIIKQYRNTASSHRAEVASNKFFIDCLQKIRSIIETETPKVCGFGRKKVVLALAQWQLQLKIIEGYLVAAFQDNDLDELCTLINVNELANLRTTVTKRAGLDR